MKNEVKFELSSVELAGIEDKVVFAQFRGRLMCRVQDFT